MNTRKNEKTILSISTPKFLLWNLVIALGITVYFHHSSLISFKLLQAFPTFLISFLISCSLSFGGFYVEHFFNQRISWIKFPVKRLLLTISTYLLYTIVISFILLSAYLLVAVDAITLENYSWQLALSNTTFSVGIAFVIITILTSRSWLLEWKKSAIEAEQLKTEVIANQYRALVEQLNPHFLFNSLNTLSGIVYEDADKSAHFIRKLSQIYRYLLDAQQKPLVKLERELKFAEDYLSLQKIRFEESLTYHIDVENRDDVFLPPLSLQLLLENAIKHNVTSTEKPLLISISSDDQVLIVENNHQPKSVPVSNGAGIGLENIKKRYAHLGDRKVVISKSDKSFRVELPLISKISGKN